MPYRRIAALGIALLAALALGGMSPPDTGDIPAKFDAPVQRNFILRDVMVPMRDGVRLRTVILIPKGVTRAPIIYSSTPYSVTNYLPGQDATRFSEGLMPSFADLATNGYIIVFQDVRGKYGSEGEYILARPLIGRWNATKADYSTDAHDTIAWLVSNVPESNGKVGMMGTSYGGYTALMGLIDPHPALKAVVPINPLADGWIGDDWFHNGALRQTYLDYILMQTAARATPTPWPFQHHDTYEYWLKAGTAKRAGESVGLDKLPAWQRILEHPAYDAYWQDQAVDRILAKRPLSVPVLAIQSQWDQEDIYGAAAVYRAIEPKDAGNDRSYLGLGPWRHGQVNIEGSALGPLKFGEDTAHWFRRNVLIPFFDAHLKDGTGRTNIAPVTAFETGANVWHRYARWPMSCASGCPYQQRSIYLQAGSKLDFTPPASSSQSFDQYVSDPAKPVTNRSRPIRPTYAKDSTWPQWLVDDQRFASDRPDVLTYVSGVLTEPVRLAGQPVARFFASTSGTDSDWIVKLIDVYPDEVPDQPELGGYQLPIAMDILRGRYRDDPSRPKPIPSGKVIGYRLKLPNVSHSFQKGHRIMVQIQSSWFPLYDRSPQHYVANIFDAQPGDFRKATQRVYRSRSYPSAIDLPVIPATVQ